MDAARRERLIELRRDLHRHPEPAWREFYTTSRIVDALERLHVDEIKLGPSFLDPERRLAVPDRASLDEWRERAREDGARADVLDAADGGYTGVAAVLERGSGPTVGLRVDIDALERRESDAPEHHPAAEGFRSANEGTMHACGHDAHIALGIGVLEAIQETDFAGTLKVVFQPAEEVVGGGKAVAEGGFLDDVAYLLAVHVGLDHPTGEVVAGIDDFLAVSHFDATFSGEPAHAGGHPEEGRNAIQAAATAIQNLYAIPRHDDGPTRVNAGKVRGGTATNIIAEEAEVEGEVRGGTTDLMRYMRDRADTVLEAAADMHRCEVAVETVGEAPSAESDEGLVRIVHDVARDHPDVTSPVERDELGGSEDAAYLMQTVQEAGGLATYVAIGTDHPGGHHTETFDVDEASIPIGVSVLTRAIVRIAEIDPLGVGGSPSA
ncbi:MAG: amidohydrolase [Halodesulfurarchaeum sp.]